MDPQPVALARQAERAAAYPAKDLKFGKSEELPSTAKHKHLTAQPGLSLLPHGTLSPAELLGVAVKDRKGNPNTGRKHSCHVAELLKRSPVAQQLQGAPAPAQHTEMLPAGSLTAEAAWDTAMPAKGKAVPVCKRCLLQHIPLLAGGEVLKDKPLAGGNPTGKGTINWCIAKAWGACTGAEAQFWPQSTVLALMERSPPVWALPWGAERPGPAQHGICVSTCSQELIAPMPWTNGLEARSRVVVVWQDRQDMMSRSVPLALMETPLGLLAESSPLTFATQPCYQTHSQSTELSWVRA